MLMSPFRKSPRHRSRTKEDLERQRALQQAYGRRSDLWIFAGLLVVPMLCVFVYELWRTVNFMRDVKTFAATIDTRPASEVKQDVGRYALHLGDPNPIIRSGSIMAMKLATGWNPGSRPGDWRMMWAQEEPYWEYHRAYATNQPAADWRALLPEKPVAP